MPGIIWWFSSELGVILNNSQTLKIRQPEYVDTKVVRFANFAMNLTAKGESMLLATYDSIHDMDVGRKLGVLETCQP
jgi:hypothetical protein